MAFCKHCGARLEEQDTYCPVCGTPTGGAEGSARLMRKEGREPRDKLFCELAYSGLLFWLPIAAGARHEHAEWCAKQGLWALILATIACTGIRLLRWLANLLSVGVLAGPAHSVYALAFLLFLLFMLFLTYRCYCAAMAIHRDQKPEALLFFRKREG